MLNLTGQRSGLGRLGKKVQKPRTVRVWAIVAAVIWFVVVVAYAVGFLSVISGTQERGTVMLDTLFFVVALILPLMLIGLMAWLAETLVQQRDAMRYLLEAISPISSKVERTGGGNSEAAALEKALHNALLRHKDGAVVARLAEIANEQMAMRAAIEALGGQAVAAPVTGFAEAEAPVYEPAAPEEAPAPDIPERAIPADLPLLPDVEDQGPPGWHDLVRALDFPRDSRDFEGFHALQVATRYRPLAEMLQAAEDVLNMFASEGIFVDDLEASECDADEWRRFLDGERGARIAGIGAIRDEEVLDKVRTMMRNDPIFRDTTLFFQRRFDRILREFIREAYDVQIVELINTRSARAYMILARISGAFDG